MARPLDRESSVREVPVPPGEVGPPRTLVQIERGGARFQVVHDPTRVFRVRSGDVQVDVLGTTFTVERLEDRVRVAVEQGRVRVRWAQGQLELGPGQSGTFPPPFATGDRAPLQRPEGQAARPASRGAPPVGEPHRVAAHVAAAQVPAPAAETTATGPAGPADWLTLAHEGRFDRAYLALPAEGPGAAQGPAELLLWADVARLSHHPQDAVAPLRRCIREHSGDPRAPLAAFTLGRVLLDELGHPREAADAFRESQDLGPGGPLAEDALAREVAAWSQAGEPLRARESAQIYLQKYPAGNRIGLVRHYGGLD
jgi:transmembrane sensor